MKSESSSKISIDAFTYSVNVCRIQVESEWLFRATVAELPDIATFENTYEAAYSLAIEAIESLYETSVEQGRAFPEARSTSESSGYSGRLTLRMPRWLHAQLGGQADAEGISLNQYLISILSAGGSINAIVYEASAKIASVGFAQGTHVIKGSYGGSLAGTLPVLQWMTSVATPGEKEHAGFWAHFSGGSQIFQTGSGTPATITETNFGIEDKLYGNC